MPGTGKTKHENPPLPPSGKGGMGGFSYKKYLKLNSDRINPYDYDNGVTP